MASAERNLGHTAQTVSPTDKFIKRSVPKGSPAITAQQTKQKQTKNYIKFQVTAIKLNNKRPSDTTSRGQCVIQSSKFKV